MEDKKWRIYKEEDKTNEIYSQNGRFKIEGTQNEGYMKWRISKQRICKLGDKQNGRYTKWRIKNRKYTKWR